MVNTIGIVVPLENNPKISEASFGMQGKKRGNNWFIASIFDAAWQKNGC